MFNKTQYMTFLVYGFHSLSLVLISVFLNWLNMFSFVSRQALIRRKMFSLKVTGIHDIHMLYLTRVCMMTTLISENHN
jgi:hypothetical protein